MIPQISPKKMKQTMARLGINVEEIDSVEDVIIKTSTKEYRFDQPSVTTMSAQGQRTYFVSGEPKITERIPAEDIALVASQANVTEERAREALEACGGNPAEAILNLIGKNEKGH